MKDQKRLERPIGAGRRRLPRTALMALGLAAGLAICNLGGRNGRPGNAVEAGPTPPPYPIQNRIDEWIQAKAAGSGVPFSAPSSDEEFLRRVYLDVIGVVPSGEEAKAFLADQAPDKRAKLIDALLADPRYGSHWSVLWGDLLREHSQSKPKEGSPRGSFRDWIRKALNQNLPYDRFVKALLTASGNAEQDGAVNFYLRDVNDRVETVNMVSAVFMGTRMACAQCHDHPFAKWEQTDFHRLMAFFAPRTQLSLDVRATLDNLKTETHLPAETRERLEPYLARAEEALKDSADLAEARARLKRKGEDAMSAHLAPAAILKRLQEQAEQQLGKQEAQRLQQAFQRARVTQVREAASGEYRMPAEGDGQKPGRPGETVEPVFPWDRALRAPPQGSRREALFSFVSGTRQFAQVQANRLWQRLLGRGLVEPVDDFRENNPPTHPELLDFLAQELVRSGYDSKHLLRLILNSGAYQLSSSPLPGNRTDQTLYSHQRLRRMTAEQLFDSILVATGRGQGLVSFHRRGELRRQLGDPAGPGGKGGERKDGQRLEWACDLPTPARNGSFLSLFGQPDRNQVVTNRRPEGSIAQALELLNGNYLNGLVAARPGALTRRLLDERLDSDEVGRELYLAAFARRPNEQEVQVIRRILKGERPAAEAVEDLHWALLNSREFLFIK